MPTCIYEIDVSELERVARSAESELERDLHRSGMDAAKAGVDLAKASHRYQDHTPGDGLTDSAHVEEEHALGGGLMTWPVEYASFVDKGTTRARAFPFTRKAIKLAGVMLQAGVNDAIARFKRALER
jgi:hypothetical protein